MVIERKRGEEKKRFFFSAASAASAATDLSPYSTSPKGLMCASLVPANFRLNRGRFAFKLHAFMCTGGAS